MYVHVVQKVMSLLTENTSCTCMCVLTQTMEVGSVGVSWIVTHPSPQSGLDSTTHPHTPIHSCSHTLPLHQHTMSSVFV